jgi:hypothetical protein
VLRRYRFADTTVAATRSNPANSMADSLRRGHSS